MTAVLLIAGLNEGVTNREGHCVQLTTVHMCDKWP